MPNGLPCWPRPTAATHILEVVATRTFLADIAFTPTEAAVWALRGDGIDDALDEVGVAGLAPGNWRPVGDGLVVRHAFGAEVVGDDLAARLAALDDVQEGDAEALDAARVPSASRVRPRGGRRPPPGGTGSAGHPRPPRQGLLPRPGSRRAHVDAGPTPPPPGPRGRRRRRGRRLDRRIGPRPRRGDRDRRPRPWPSCPPTPRWGKPTRATAPR
jgi:hypothetical protein